MDLVIILERPLTNEHTNVVRFFNKDVYKLRVKDVITYNAEWNNKQNDTRYEYVPCKSFILSMQSCFTSINTDITIIRALLFARNKIIMAC